MGAWIEIFDIGAAIVNKLVAPSMGAWIEIHGDYRIYRHQNVAPSMGAWIEIIPVPVDRH